MRPEAKAAERAAIRQFRNQFRIKVEARARQAAKLAEIREALVTAGYDSAAKQGAVLGVCRGTAWLVLNRDNRAGPSAGVIKRILSSPHLPPAVRRKVEEYVEQKIRGLYGHCELTTRRFRNQFDTSRRNPNSAKAIRRATSSRRRSLTRVISISKI
jgi:hypothetical protein